MIVACNIEEAVKKGHPEILEVMRDDLTREHLKHLVGKIVNFTYQSPALLSQDLVDFILSSTNTPRSRI